jgi:hypothetical protein
MTFAGDYQHVASAQVAHRRPDRLGAVADLLGAGCRRQDRGADRRGVLAAGIVVGDDDAIGLLGRDPAHQRALGAVAVAAAADDADEAPGGEGAQRV